MIRRNRDLVPPPPSLSEAAAEAERNGNRNLAQTGMAQNIPLDNIVKSMKFDAYSATDVRDALWRLFGQKCAYCEASLLNNDVHVDHHRPKGKLDGADNPGDHPGYWWLGSAWENLLPACQHCNRSPQYDPATQTKYESGKRVRFPLLPGSTRCMSEGDGAQEQPALLDPTIDEPSYFFTVRPHGTRPLIGIRPGRGVSDALRADESIAIYGLNRPGLADARALHVAGLFLTLDQLKDNLDDLREETNMEKKAKYEQRCTRTWQNLYTTYLSSHELPFLMTSVRITEIWFKWQGMKLADYLPLTYDLVPLHFDDEADDAAHLAEPVAPTLHPRCI